MGVRIGVDQGGTKLEAMALSDAGEEMIRTRVATPRDDYPATVRAVCDLVQGVESQLGSAGQASVGVGIPGTISPATGLIKNANSTWLNGKPLDRDLSEALSRPVRLANDADCFALSEAKDGAGQGAAIVFGVILGTGVGAGVVAEGRLLRGPNATTGEWGHNPLPWMEAEEYPGPHCWCGLSGCIETWLSGPALLADHRRTHPDAAKPTTVEALLTAAQAGDATARQSFARHGRRLAKALASVINMLDPTVIVLGGGLSNLSHLYAEVPAQWDQWAFGDRVDTALVRARHGDSGGVRGAAWLWEVGEFQPAAASP